MADTEGSSDPQVSFKVKTSGDGLHSITMAESATVLDLKAKLATEEYENIPVERQRLIYSGRVMKNDDTLGSYKIKTGNTLHLVKSAASNHPPAGSAAAGAGAGSRSSAPPPAVPTNMAAGTPANDLLAGLTGARFAGHANLPSQDLFGPDGGMNFASEEQMAEMLNNPAVAQSMNEALSNPAFIDYLIQSNPAFRNIPNAREIFSSPMFRSMITDPETMRTMSRMRSAMGSGARGANSFPAPGATDNTPADAASTPSGGAAGAGAPGAGGAGAAANNPFGGFNPFMFGFPGAGGAGGGAGSDTATNPFAAFFPPGFGAAGAGATPGAAAGTGSDTAGANTAAGEGGDATRATGTGTGNGSADAGAGANAAANPFASLFGGAGGAGMPQISPEQMQQAMQMLNGLGGAGGASSGASSTSGAAGGAGFNPFAAFSAPAQDTRSPEERYASQLRQLNEMGFYDFDQNVAALRRSGGSVEGALAHLLGN
ncbi:hypothetical protein HMPREF1624_06888 [Sporothrix schenckii ATCC 58251]|uniref:Deubiquitination-protection protein dph1 n=1 Tax=Sporothrix schenckii (strain ATCC 58251 / de Perez 2211183) TaxID=1391915 RepID=U7PPK3_SPOS1|nr:hypothetical protein HMPREF1624_06888 [Sporothrix schenckii ATCC 58251]